MGARQQPLGAGTTARAAVNWRRVLLATSVAGALLAQWALDSRVAPALAGGLSMAAALTFGATCGAFRGGASRRWREDLDVGQASPAMGRLAWPPVVGGAVFGALAFTQLGGNRFTLGGLSLWLVGLLLLGVAAWEPADRGGAGRSGTVRGWLRAGGIALQWRHLALLGVMAVAAFLRFYRLAGIPLEMGCDLPLNYANVREILSGAAPIFFPSHPGREALFFYLTAPLAAVFGLSHTTIKASSAIIGVATLPAVYALGKELRDRETGLVAATLLGVSHWHVILTRVGYRAAVMPLVLALMWLFWARGLRTGRKMDYALAGLFLGLGFYTYNAFVVVPLFVVLLLLGEALAGRGRRFVAHGPGLALLATMAALVLIPLARYVWDDPFRYSYRIATRLTALEQPLPADLFGTLVRNVARTLAMFTYEGDALFITNVAFLRQLGYLAAVGFMLGAGYTLWRWRREGWGILMGLLVTVIPSVMALAFPGEVPSAVRAIGAIVPAMLLAAIGVTQVRREAAALLRPDARTRRAARVALAVVAFVALAGETRATYRAYFRDYVWQQPDHNYSISLEMARAIDDFADTGTAYLLAAPYWYDGNAVRAQLRRSPEWDHELMELVPGEPPLDGGAGRVMVIVHPQNGAALDALDAAFADGIVLEHANYDGTPAFLTFYGER